MYLFIYPVEIQIKSDMQCGEVWFCLDRIEAVRHIGEWILYAVRYNVEFKGWAEVPLLTTRGNHSSTKMFPFPGFSDILN